MESNDKTRHCAVALARLTTVDGESATLLDRLAAEFEAKTGLVVGRSKSELLVIVREVAHTLDACIAVQQAADTEARESGVAAQLVVTADFGRVTSASGRISGDPVDHVREMADVAPERAVVITKGLAIALDRPITDAADAFPHPDPVRERTRPLGMLLIEWQGRRDIDRDETRMPYAKAPRQPRFYDRIELRWGDQRKVVAKADCPISIGRDSGCDVVLSNSVASRRHARIVYENDKFYLEDDSRHGTYLLSASGEEIYLREERCPLAGRGLISPGVPVSRQDEQVLKFASMGQELQIMDAPADNGPTERLRRR